MKRTLFLTTLLLSSVAAMAQNTTIDFSGNNSSNDYKSYSTAFSIATGKTVEVKMARYCYFSSKITGKGTLMLYGGGERCYLVKLGPTGLVLRAIFIFIRSKRTLLRRASMEWCLPMVVSHRQPTTPLPMPTPERSILRWLITR